MYFKLQKMHTQKSEFYKFLNPVLTVCAESITSTLVTLTSFGTGTLGAVALAYLCPLKLTSPK